MPVSQLSVSKINEDCEVAIDLVLNKIYVPTDGVLLMNLENENIYGLSNDTPLSKAISIIKETPPTLSPFFYSPNYRKVLISFNGKNYANSLNNEFYCVFISKTTGDIFVLEDLPVIKIRILNKKTIDLTIMDLTIASRTFDPNTVNTKAKVDILPDIISVVYDKTQFDTKFASEKISINQFVVPMISDWLVSSNTNPIFDYSKQDIIDYPFDDFYKKMILKYFTDNFDGLTTYLIKS